MSIEDCILLDGGLVIWEEPVVVDELLAELCEVAAEVLEPDGAGELLVWPD